MTLFITGLIAGFCLGALVVVVALVAWTVYAYREAL